MKCLRCNGFLAKEYVLQDRTPDIVCINCGSREVTYRTFAYRKGDITSDTYFLRGKKRRNGIKV